MASVAVATHEGHQQRFLGRMSSSNRTSKLRRAPESMVAVDSSRERGYTAMKAGVPYCEAASDDSSTFNRKSMSLNADPARESWRNDTDPRHGFLGSQHFGATNLTADATISVLEMTRSERAELRRKLRRELERLRILSCKLDEREYQVRSQSQSVGLHYGCSDAQFSGNDTRSCPGREVTSYRISTPVGKSVPVLRDIGIVRQHSFSTFEGDFSLKEKRTPKANQLYHNSEFLMGKDKMPPPEKSKTKPSSGSKRGALLKPDSRDKKRLVVEHSISRQFSDLLRQCGTLLKRLMGHKHGWVFNEPVDPVKLGLTDYFMVIKRPMDLGTVKQKLSRNDYFTPVEFAEDVRLTFSNAMTYNPPMDEVYAMADVLRKLFEEKWRVIDEKYEEERSRIDEESMALYEQRPRLLPVPVPCVPERLQREEVSDQSQVKSKKAPACKKVSVSSCKPKAHPKPRREMTFQEKKKLSANLQLLPMDKMDHIVQLMKEKNPDLNQKGDVIEVDIATFDKETLWELHRYVTSCMKAAGKNKKGSQSLSVAGSQLGDGLGDLACKGQKGDPGDEDVDIDDDMPDASFPPVVIDKDRGYASRSSTSGSSSSDSGSSSDSDSGSLSGSDSDADDAQSADRRF